MSTATAPGDTGLPPLPEKEFWRIKRDIEGSYLLELRRKTWYMKLGRWSWQGSKMINVRYLRSRDVTNPPVIYTAAENMLADVERSVQRLRMMGDYPPNRLGDI